MKNSLSSIILFKLFSAILIANNVSGFKFKILNLLFLIFISEAALTIIADLLTKLNVNPLIFEKLACELKIKVASITDNLL